MNFEPKTAFLLFASSESVQSAVKPIAGTKKQNLLLWHKMNENALSKIKKSKLPYFIADETVQKGDTFGKKITNAINDVFNQGYDQVVVIGNDCPELKAKHINDTIKKLSTNDAVFGPDFNGGVYLIGVSKSSFEAAKFESISWQTSLVYNELNSLFCQSKIALLPFLNDCNTTYDFKKALGKLSFAASFRNFLQAVLQNNSYLFFTAFSATYSLFTPQNYNKGSPV